MEKIETICPSCSPDDPVSHTVLKGKNNVILQCDECKSVHKEIKPKKFLVRVIVNKGKESIHTKAMLSGIVRKEDELLIDDENTGEAFLVLVTSIEVGDKRPDEADAKDIKTIWSRAIDEAIVKFAISHRETTESVSMRVPGDREFVIGDKVEVNNRKLKIIRIKIRDGGFKSRKGVAICAKYIKRIYADSGIKEPKRFSRAKGERIVIKKRDSVWSLRSKGKDLSKDSDSTI
ncbi:MAG: HVO_0476 family zinc finger protein [Candidatus Methanoperedens sp.]|nr:HVO_0476 family zinc finger protein [Candidatus Methanoperedens sp.]